MCSPTRLPIIKLPAGTAATLMQAPRPVPVSRRITAAPTTNSIDVRHNHRRRDFLLFVKVLIKIIEKSNNYKLTLQAKAMVSECVKRNRMGDPHFTPLKESIELRLRGLVGPDYWNQAQNYMHCYRAAQSQKRQLLLGRQQQYRALALGR